MSLRSRATRGAAALAAAAVVTGVLAAAPTAAQAAAGPYVGFIDFGGSVDDPFPLKVGAPDGSGAVAVAPDNIDAYTYDVSDDGTAMVVGASEWLGADTTVGLALVRKDPGSGDSSTTLLSSAWDTQPAISADGTHVWWLYNGYLYTYDTAGPSTDRTAAPVVPLKGGETVVGMAVSPDGGKLAAVVQTQDSNGEATAGRLVLADTATGTTRTARTWPTSDAYRPTVTTLTWADASTVLYSVFSKYTQVQRAYSAPVSGSLVLGTSTPGPLGYYSHHKLGSDWWMFHDTGSGASFTTHFGTSSAPFTLPATDSTRGDGDHTSYYKPMTGMPGMLGEAVNRAGAHPYLAVHATTVDYGTPVVVVGYDHYVTPNTGMTLTNDGYYTEHGVLQRSYDNTSWSYAASTTAAKSVAWPGQPGRTGNGRTPALTRSAWLRWSYAGDLYTRPGITASVRVQVRSRVLVRLGSSAGRTLVRGAVTRHDGTVTLYRLVSGGKTKVATATISSSGAYSFGYRSLARGTYKVFTTGDAYQAAGTATFILR